MPDASIDGTAEALARRLLTDLPARQPVGRAALDPLPSPVAQLLHAQLNARVDRETALPATPWIDRDHAAVREAQSSWREAIRTAAQIPADAWEDMLAEAARLAIAHLVQPASTLASTAFADPLAAQDPLPTPLVLDRLRAFGPFPYLIEIVERYVEKKGLGHIDHDGLERLLLRIDSRMVSGFSADEWLTLLDPLFDLLEGQIPASLLQLAFEARGQRPLVADLDGDAILRDVLHAHLETALSHDASHGDESAPAPQPVAEPIAAAPDVVQAPAMASVVVEPTVSEPLAEEIPVAPEPEPEIIPELESLPEPNALDELAKDPTPVDRPTIAHSFEVEPRRPAPAPPVIGSKFTPPEEVAPDDSDVLGPARPVEIVEPMEPMVSLDAPSGSITDAVVTETLEETASSEDAPLWKRLAGSSGPAPASPPPAETEATPLWAQFSPGTSPVASSTPSDVAPAPADPRSAFPDPPFWPETSPAPAPPTDASLHAIELAVLGTSDADRRAWYTDELFSGNADDYEATLRQLDAAQTWTEATDIIARDVFRKHSVNIYSDPAVTFTDAVEARMEAR